MPKKFLTKEGLDNVLAAVETRYGPLLTHNHDSKYLGLTATAADSDKLDGKHLSEIVPRAYYLTGGASAGGVLIATDLLSIHDNMTLVEIKGNAYSEGIPIDSVLQFYNYVPYNSILQYRAINNGKDIGPFSVFVHDGVVKIWIPRVGPFVTYFVTVRTASSPLYNHVTSITQSAMPTEGVSRLVTVTPSNAVRAQGTATQFIMGDGSLKPLTDITGSYYDKTTADGRFARLGKANNFVFGGNEVTIVGGLAIDRSIYLNYQLADNSAGSIIDYNMMDGHAGYAALVAKSFKMPGGTASQFMKADGSLDSNAYFHSGNMGPGSGLNADMLDGYHASSFLRQVVISSPQDLDANTLTADNTIYTTTGDIGSWSTAFTNFPTAKPHGSFFLINIREGAYKKQIYSAYQDNHLYVRRSSYLNGEHWGEWEKVAFTGDNVASATKLATARTLWGQSFNGSGNVRGNMSGVGNVVSSTGAYELRDDTTNPFVRLSSGGKNCYVQGYLGRLLIGGATGGNYAVVDDIGNVGIGIGSNAPAYPLDVNGTARVSGGIISNSTNGCFMGNAANGLGSGHTGGLFYAYGANPLYFYTNSEPRMIIDGAGNVGIGTPTPAYPLDVNGTARVNDSLIVAAAADAASVPLYGIYSQGGIVTNGNVTAQNGLVDTLLVNAQGMIFKLSNALIMDTADGPEAGTQAVPFAKVYVKEIHLGGATFTYDEATDSVICDKTIASNKGVSSLVEE